MRKTAISSSLLLLTLSLSVVMLHPPHGASALPLGSQIGRFHEEGERAPSSSASLSSIPISPSCSQCPAFVSIDDPDPHFLAREYADAVWLATVVQSTHGAADPAGATLSTAIMQAQADGLQRLRTALRTALQTTSNHPRTPAPQPRHPHPLEPVVPVVRVRVLPDMSGGIAPSLLVALFLPHGLPPAASSALLDMGCFVLVEEAHTAYAVGFAYPDNNADAGLPLDREILHQALLFGRELRRSNVASRDTYFELVSYGSIVPSMHAPVTSVTVTPVEGGFVARKHELVMRGMDYVSEDFIRL